MPFKPNRLRELREAKGIRTHEELAAVTGLSRPMLSKYESGAATPPPDVLEALAETLDATMDYFYGRGKHYPDAVRAAIEMAFDVFARNIQSDEQLTRCRRVLADDEAPRTADAWKTLAHLIDLAVPPSKKPPELSVVGRKA